MTGLFPKIVNLELSNRCNLACVFCDHAELRKTMPLGDMPSDVLERILQQITGRGVYELGLVGLGEPLLDSMLADHLALISRYSQAAQRISLNSNATLLTADKAELLLHSPVNFITFSLNATSRESYRTLMGRDMFETAVENIKGFVAALRRSDRTDLKVGIQFMRSDYNEEQAIHSIFAGYESGQVNVFSREVFHKPALDERGRGLVNVNVLQEPARHPCWSLYSRVYINIHGDVYPCTIGNDSYRDSENMRIGNVLQADLAAIFNNAHIAAARQRCEAGEIAFPECADCTLWELFPKNFVYRDGAWRLAMHEDVRKKSMDRS